MTAGYLIYGLYVGGIPFPQYVHGFQRLWLQPVHDVHHEDGQVTHGGAAAPEVAEGLVARGVYDEEAGQLDFCLGKL